MKKIVLFALGLVAVATAHAQDEKAKVETTVAADFVTNYIWRGLDCGNISVQPRPDARLYHRWIQHWYHGLLVQYWWRRAG